MRAIRIREAKYLLCPTGLHLFTADNNGICCMQKSCGIRLSKEDIKLLSFQGLSIILLDEEQSSYKVVQLSNL